MRNSAWLLFFAAALNAPVPAAADAPAPLLRPAAAGDAGTARPSVLPKPGTPVATASGVNYTGTIVVDFTITLRTPLATSTPIYCTLSAEFAGDSNPYATIYKYNYIEATRSGSSATCKVSLPYGLYGLLSPTKDYVSVSYAISAAADSPVIVNTMPASVGTSINGSIPLSTLPANGKTTTLAVDVIL